MLIVGHSGLVTYGATYFTGSASHYKLSQGPNGGGGRKYTGLLVRHDRINKKTDLINPDDFNTSLTRPEMYEIFNNFEVSVVFYLNYISTTKFSFFKGLGSSFYTARIL